MKRRHFIHLGVAGMAGCTSRKLKTAKEASACPFTITIPEQWRDSMVVEKVPIFPLYSPEDWKNFQKDKLFEMKPGYSNRPRHWAIRLPGASSEPLSADRNENAGDDPTYPQILIHKADEWNLAFTDGKHEEREIAKTLRFMRESMDAAMAADDPRLSPGYVDASLEFMCLKRRLDFTGGHGVRLVAQWTIEPDLLRLGELHYLFLGMSDDDSIQIVATFPLNLPGLPASEERDHLGKSTQDYPAFSKSYDTYQTDATKWMEQYGNEITPSLAELDDMIQSLVAVHWKDS